MQHTRVGDAPVNAELSLGAIVLRSERLDVVEVDNPRQALTVVAERRVGGHDDALGLAVVLELFLERCDQRVELDLNQSWESRRCFFNVNSVRIVGETELSRLFRLPSAIYLVRYPSSSVVVVSCQRHVTSCGGSSMGTHGGGKWKAERGRVVDVWSRGSC